MTTDRWEVIDRHPSNLDLRIKQDKTIFGGYVVVEALKLWGRPEDQELEAYKKRKSAKA